MLLKNYVFWPEALPISLCDQIVKYGTQQPTEGAKLGVSTKAAPKEIRDSTVSFLNALWILDWIKEPLDKANRDIFKFNLSNLEEFQFTQYKKGQFYDWHVDQHHLPYEKHASNYDGKVRKLSLTINLSDPKSYEGGNFMFDYRDKPEKPSNVETCTILRNQGTIVVFPSFVFHKVSPVTKGTRHSLVNWTIGAPWK